MTEKIFKGMISVVVTVMVLCAVFLIGILYDYFNNLIFYELENQAYLISNSIMNDGDDYIERISELENRITIINPDGSVGFDNESDIASMDNHATREEVKEALENGEGKSSRYSDTIGTNTLYYAKKIDDGRVVRVSTKVNSVWTLVLGVLHPMIFVLIIAAIVAALISKTIAKRILQPINSIDLNNPELDEPYEELAPLLKKIRHQNKRIDSHIQELKRNQKEFRIITENMSEGFLIIDKKTEILSYNTSALKLLNVTEEDAAKCKSVLAVNRSESFRTAVELALGGEHNEQPMNNGDRCYHIVANPVFHSGVVTGVIIIILDVTEKTKREHLRQEFTSNVSHELKTPLTTIYGISDMMCGGIVKSEDMSVFADKIRMESKRMITLINDIIKLSQLDEGGTDVDRQNVDLLAVAKRVSERLEYAAEQAEVIISVTGKSTVVKGAPALIEDIIYNLADNAIKYNRKNGRVDIIIDESNNRQSVTVADTGIGIPNDSKERIFERFYRVDKSHSRTIGGTGLGLSIVKHAVAFHGASIELESTENVGTSIKIIFQ